MTIKLPEWFKVGAKVRIHNSGPFYEVLSIDHEDGSWVASEYGDRQKYPLDEVVKHWGLCPESVVRMLSRPDYERGTA